MTNPYRAMCAELVDSVELLLEMRAVDAKRMTVTEDRVSRARALLAQPVAESPADGEVAELVDLIRQIALAWEPDACLLGNMTARQLARAVNLLERPTPQPVAVSERLPERGDCTA